MFSVKDGKDFREKDGRAKKSEYFLPVKYSDLEKSSKGQDRTFVHRRPVIASSAPPALKAEDKRFDPLFNASQKSSTRLPHLAT